MAFKNYNQKELKTKYDATEALDSTLGVGAVLNLIPEGINGVKRRKRDFDNF